MGTGRGIGNSGNQEERLSQARQRLGVRQSSAALAPPVTSKAPEDWRSPKPDGAVVAPFQIKSGNGDGARDWELRKSGGAFESGAAASWSAAVQGLRWLRGSLRRKFLKASEKRCSGGLRPPNIHKLLGKTARTYHRHSCVGGVFLGVP